MPFTDIYSLSGFGNISKKKFWTGAATTSSGAWSVNYSSAGFTSAPVVIPIVQLESSNVYDRAFASLRSAPTSTAATGYAVRGANLSLLGSSTRVVPDGTVVHVMAIGD